MEENYRFLVHFIINLMIYDHFIIDLLIYNILSKILRQ